MHPKALQDPRKRKMLVYAGVAAAILLVALLARRNQAAAAAAQQGQQPQPVSNPAVDPASYYAAGTGAGGVDYSAQLGTPSTDLNTISQQIANQQSGQQTPGPNTPGTGGTLTTADVTGILGALTAAELAGTNIYQAGQQHGPGTPKPGKPKPKPKPHGHPKPKGHPGHHPPPHHPPAHHRPRSRAYHRHG